MALVRRSGNLTLVHGHKVEELVRALLNDVGGGQRGHGAENEDGGSQLHLESWRLKRMTDTLERLG